MQITSTKNLRQPKGLLSSIFSPIKSMLLGGNAKVLEDLKRVKDDLLKAREEKCQIELSSERAHAVAGATSMLAHDIRKPFALLRLTLEVLPQLKEEQIEQCSREVDLSISKVESMLSDITECSRGAKYTLTPENVLTVLNLSIKDTSRYNPKKQIEFYYNLEILNLVNMDEHRLSRAFDNVIGNAFEAMPEENAFMWFVAREYNDRAEIIIGNSGPHIPENEIHKIFDCKFTSGKKSGIGLGLSITKKVIEGHKGSVIARNVKHAPDNIRNARGVEFVITLPLTNNPGNTLRDPLLKNSKEAS